MGAGLRVNNEEQSVARPSIAARIWKYKLHYLIVIPAIILIIVFKLIPLVIIRNLYSVRVPLHAGKQVRSRIDIGILYGSRNGDVMVWNSYTTSMIYTVRAEKVFSC
jgi:ABC-type sugar transport system permease subunit